MFPHIDVWSDLSSHIEIERHGYPCWSDAVVTTSHSGNNIMDMTEVDHWHPDFEFIYFTQGGNTAFVNGSAVEVGEEQALFINSRRIHHYKMPESEKRFIVLRIHPNIFIQNTSAGLEYYERKFSTNAPDYVVFDPSVDWQKSVVDGIIEIHDCLINIATRPIKALSVILRVMDIIGEHIEDSDVNNKHTRDYADFYRMSEFIRHHFNENISIDNLENCSHTSRTRVFQLFKKYADSTPQNFITKYRVNYGTQLLQNTNLSVSDISTMCGFSTPSHFTTVFSREKGMTPREFRNSLK